MSSDPLPIDFDRDVMAVLAKSGCNLGTCHGNFNGKGGFFLSLRGQDPSYDFEQLVRAATGRRINRLEPAQSLILQKATAQIAHRGGRRFTTDDPEFVILKRWIEEGLVSPQVDPIRVSRLEVSPQQKVLWNDENQVALKVTASFSDGTERDVTRLAVYEPSDPLVEISKTGVVRFGQPTICTIIVRYLDQQIPVRLAYRQSEQSFEWSGPEPENFIDDEIYTRLRQLRINPAPAASDAVFMRRVYLDLIGTLPTADEARSFVASTSSEKRARLVDRLLHRPEFADVWALKWSDVLRNEEKTLDARGVETLHNWIRECFENDLPLDDFVRQILSSRGSSYKNPPANYWRAHREPLVRAETTAQVFLGVRLQCAKCHNHPFDQWTQAEYYSWATLFAGIDYEVLDNKRKDDLDKHEFVGEQIIKVTNEGFVKNPQTGKDAAPQYLGDETPVEGDRLESLAQWVTSPGNERFAKAQVNRLWYHLMGAGLIEPIDDLRSTNPASHPELLEQLAQLLIDSDFQIKPVIRTIVLSNTYQAATELDEIEIAPHDYDDRLFARAVMRRLTAEQIADAQSQILGIPAKFEGYDLGTRAGQIAGVERVRRRLSPDDLLLRQFGKPERLLACECERSNDATLGQALSLIGSDSLNERLSRSENRIGRLLDEHQDVTLILDELFWTALTRPPTQSEIDQVMALIEQTGDARPILEDVCWALINAKALLFRN